MYVEVTYKMLSVIDVEKYHTGRYGAPGCKRQPKRKRTPEEIRNQNYINACKRLRRIINNNFEAGDLHCTLTYKQENRLSAEDSKKELTNFLRRMKSAYRKRGHELKWIAVTEYQNKAIHHHMIINMIPDTVPLLQEQWRPGRVHFTPLDDSGDYRALADYLIKETEKTFRDPEAACKERYSRSRNLIIPEPKKKVISSASFRKAPKPIKGYYIDTESVCTGFNPVTGYPYQTYTMIKIGGG